MISAAGWALQFQGAFTEVAPSGGFNVKRCNLCLPCCVSVRTLTHGNTTIHCPVQVIIAAGFLMAVTATVGCYGSFDRSKTTLVYV